MASRLVTSMVTFSEFGQCLVDGRRALPVFKSVTNEFVGIQFQTAPDSSLSTVERNHVGSSELLANSRLESA